MRKNDKSIYGVCICNICAAVIELLNRNMDQYPRSIFLLAVQILIISPMEPVVFSNNTKTLIKIFAVKLARIRVPGTTGQSISEPNIIQTPLSVPLASFT